MARKRAYRRAGGQRFSMNFIFVLYVVYIKYDYPGEDSDGYGLFWSDSGGC
jgi:hypothetical protein